MNSVSLFLYFADVLDNLRSAIIPVMVFGFMATVACTIAGILMHAGNYSWVTDKDRDWYEARRASFASAARILWPAILLTIISFAFIPSKGTMYAIAASQVGEQVVNSETVKGITNDATKALQIWIKKQIEPAATK